MDRIENDNLKFLRQSPSFFPRSIRGKEVKLLVPIGASISYIKPLQKLMGIQTALNLFSVKSIHEVTPIRHKCKANIFGVVPKFLSIDFKMNTIWFR